jgi:hypothetical protein
MTKIEKKYQVVAVNDRGHVTRTAITGSYAERTADRLYHELAGDAKSKYVVLMTVDDSGPGNVRAEYFAGQPLAKAVNDDGDAWKYYSIEQFGVHIRRMSDGKWYWMRTLNDRWGPYASFEHAMERVQEYDKKLIADDDRSGRKAFWHILTMSSDRWGRTMNDRSNAQQVQCE